VDSVLSVARARLWGAVGWLLWYHHVSSSACVLYIGSLRLPVSHPPPLSGVGRSLAAVSVCQCAPHRAESLRSRFDFCGTPPCAVFGRVRSSFLLSGGAVKCAPCLPAPVGLAFVFDWLFLICPDFFGHFLSNFVVHVPMACS
jgi:hypothetical protein